MTNNLIFNNDANSLKTLCYGTNNNAIYAIATDSNGKLIISNASELTAIVNNLPLTAFGDLRSSILEPVTGWTFNYGVLSGIITSSTANSGTISTLNSMVHLSTGTNSAGSSSVSTKKALRYSPGIGALVRFTAVFTTGVSNSTQIIGIGDNSDGFFFGYNNATFGILIRKNNVDTWVPQSSWSQDPMNGTGTSGITLDFTKGNVFQIQYQWLGFGTIRFSIENPITGSITPVHLIQYANQYTTPSLLNPTLPITALVENTGNTSNLSLYSPSSMAFTEGSSYSTAISSRYTFFIEAVNISSDTKTTLFAIRNKSTFNSKTNRVRVQVDLISTSTESTKIVYFYLISNPNITGGTFVDIDTTNSVIESSTNPTYTGGHTTLFIPTAKSSSSTLSLSDQSIILSPNESLILAAKSSAHSDVSASVSWIEYY